MAVNDFKDLVVWKKSMELAKGIYGLVKYFPKEETYGLSDQMRRAAVSIPSNIAEGHARQTTKDYIRFLYIARGSRAELETQLLLAKDLGYFQAVSEQDLDSLLALTDEIGRMLFSIITKLTSES